MLTRRHFIITSAALFSAPLAGTAAAQDAVSSNSTQAVTRHERAGRNPWGLHPRFMPTRVAHRDGLRVGDIHVDPVAKYLYHIGNDGTAMRYGVAVGRQGLQSPGTFTINRKVEWPSWTPTANMIRVSRISIRSLQAAWPVGRTTRWGTCALPVPGRRGQHVAHPRHAAAMVDRNLGVLGLRAAGQ
jgi:lipoprotein-anchoring transpeptidase ErfK/SrfK